MVISLCILNFPYERSFIQSVDWLVCQPIPLMSLSSPSVQCCSAWPKPIFTNSKEKLWTLDMAFAIIFVIAWPHMKSSEENKIRVKECLYDIYRVTDIRYNNITKITNLVLFTCRGFQRVQESSYFLVIHEFGWRFS